MYAVVDPSEVGKLLTAAAAAFRPAGLQLNSKTTVGCAHAVSFEGHQVKVQSEPPKVLRQPLPRRALD
eukprot:4665761-Prorocentrum_lima.AAC.1